MAIGETNEERAERLDRNEGFSLDLISKSAFSWRQLGDYHYFVGERFDYWPRTGLFIERRTKKRGRGVRNLIKRLKEQK